MKLDLIQLTKSKGGRFITFFWIFGLGYQYASKDKSFALTVKLWKLHTFFSVSIF